MTGMDDLVTWLRAQWDARLLKLDEDERAALAAAGVDPHWVIDREFHPSTPYIRQLGIYSSPSTAPGHVDPEQCEHIARWDPQRVLAEVAAERKDIEAKRQILDWAIAWRDRDCAPWNSDCIRLLAEPYAGRDGWREEWRA